MHETAPSPYMRALRGYAVTALAMKNDIVLGDAVGDLLAELLQRPLELRVLERGDPPAAVADQVVVMLSARQRRLVVGLPVAEIEPRHELEVGQRLECAIHRGAADRVAPGVQLIVDVARGK